MPVTELDQVLADMRRAGGIRAIAIVSRDGILIASDMPAEIHPETFAAMSAIILGAAETAALEINTPAPDRIIVETDEGRLVVSGAGERMMLVALAEAQAGLGHVIVEMSRAVDRIKELFGESPG
ncbi:MAG: Roadblock/LC7 domain protein [Methanocella sp. PtaU1.Bin125]|nr:MAG: Roadblock/LC7 domain protein [Methanocella sp. PtaU1.Bin125]